MTISTTGGVIPTAGDIRGIAITGAPSGAGDTIISTSTTAAEWATPSSSGVADILDLPTAETDTTKVLAPDGIVGVGFRAEAGGRLASWGSRW